MENPNQHMSSRAKGSKADNPQKMPHRSARKVQQKRDVRMLGRQRKNAIPFGDLANHPVYQKIVETICPEDLSQELKKFGIQHIAQVSALGSMRDTGRSTLAATGEKPSHPPQELIDRAQREAQRAFRIMQRFQSLKDPMNQGLRHTRSHLSGPLEEAFQNTGIQYYANPSSLQSNQSAGAYLRHLYRIATGLDQQIGILPPTVASFRLANRRPDLAKLRLSESNLKQEIPTIEIVNEVLEEGLGRIDVQKVFFPIALPFDEAAVTTRAALSQISGTRLNTIYSETVTSGFPLRAGFRLAGDVAGLLGLIGASDASPASGSTLSLLTESNADLNSETVSTAADLYASTDVFQISNVSHLKSSLDLDFEALTQLLGLYAVEQEMGGPVAQKDYATAFLQNNTEFVLVDLGISGLQIWKDAGPLEAPDLRSIHYLARLYHATGLDFHHLNVLLSVPGAALSMDPKADPDSVARRRPSSTGLRLLAGFTIYRETFGLSPEAYAALFGTICPYRRADKVVENAQGAIAGLEQTEISFMGALFRQDAPWLHQTVTEATTPITHGTLSNILQRGLGLSAAELDAVVQALDHSFKLTTALDASGLAAVYRIAKTFQMLDWPTLPGLALVSHISTTTANQLMTNLTAKNKSELQTENLCTALDWLVALARWMDEVELSPANLLDLLTTTDAAQLRATDADLNWLRGLATAIAPNLVTPQTFSQFEVWNTQSEATVFLSGESWHEHMNTLDTMYRSSGVFYPDQDQEAIALACHSFLATVPEIDLQDKKNLSQLEQLISMLERTRDNQVQTQNRRIADLSPNLKPTGAGPLILWAQTNPLDLLQVLLNGSNDPDALFQLYELRRYAAASEALSLGDVELWLIALTPDWVAPNAATAGPFPAPKPLNLEQLFYLQRFTRLQVGTADDAAWRGYLILVNQMQPDAQASGDEVTAWRAACGQALALLLNSSFEETVAYTEDLFGPGSVADDIEKVDAVSRHIQLARRLQLGADKLLALKAVADSQKSGDWIAAKNAALTGLSLFDSGTQVSASQNAVSEKKRDALVAAYMASNIAANPILAEHIVDQASLYSHLLLDVQVTSAVPTSRIVEAISSLQLYISRALNGHEKGVGFVDRDTLAAQWQIDKQYRTWEANQKLSLYPQNYIEPELRINTSPQFDELLGAISGSDLNENGAESAVNTYMAGLSSVCSLSVCSIFVERLADGVTPTSAHYHLLAHADWEHGRFFYRKLEADFKTIADLQDSTQYLKALDWTFWQEVDIPTTYQLFSDVSVCVFQNRYFFFWLEIEERKTQSSDGEKVVWRLHPRYMRCDVNALTGQMYGPNIFLAGELEGPVSMEIKDGAFEWPGAKPSIGTTYHPMTVEDACVQGVSGKETGPTKNLSKAIYVTFGLVLNDSEDSGTQNDSHQTSLQMRLTNDWSDAILLLEQPLDTRFQDHAPRDFTCVHPQLSTRFALERDTIAAPDSNMNMFQHFTVEKAGERPELDLREQWYANGLQATFMHAPTNSPHIGTIEISFRKDYRQHQYYIPDPGDYDPSGYFSRISIERMVQTFLQPFLSVDDHDITQTISDAPIGGDDTLWYPSDIEDIPFEAFQSSKYTSENDMRACALAIPEDWMVKLGETRKIDVKVKISQTFGEYWINYYRESTGFKTEKFHRGSVHVTALDVPIGSFLLQLEFAKRNTAWSKSDVHGSRNFLHIFDSDAMPVNQSILLLNSSSALTKLANSVPVPGDFRGLFTLGNQTFSEELGNFVSEYQQSLQVLYPTDHTPLDQRRTPSKTFDFDAAYGGYGWEVFYHIPSAFAAAYADQGQFEESLSWFEKIFDPKLDAPWRVHPLADASAAENGLAFDTGDVIVDPDRIATDYPFFYQQATIRHVLETMIAAGDAAYEQQTQETLQQAKAYYAQARQLFNDNLSETLDVLTNQPWRNPSLAEVAADGYYGFLPPINQELHQLYDTIEARLTNLRHWLDIEGNPLNVPLLSAPIDPRLLQQAAKAGLPLSAVMEAEEEQGDPPLDFNTVARAVRHYIGNLKTTSSRLQANSEKADAVSMAHTLRTHHRNKTRRALELQKLAINVSEKHIHVKQAELAAANSAFATYVSATMARLYSMSMLQTVLSFTNNRKRLQAGIGLIRTKLVGKLKGTLPTVFGMANGGQENVMPNIIDALFILGKLMDVVIGLTGMNNKTSIRWKYAESASTIAELTSKVAAASAELSEAKASRDLEEKTRDHLEVELEEAEAIVRLDKASFANKGFYDWMLAELEQLFIDEWAITQDFCQLLITLYEDETGLKNGAGFLKTTSPGSGYERLNAPYRLALDIEHLEVAYTRSLLERQGQSANLTFLLSETPALGGQATVLEALLQYGEAYFALTEDMFEALYPGQYDRRIQSVAIHFPGLAKAGLNPHARLIQLANTRYLTRERDPKRGGKRRENRYALQSIVLSKPKVDTATFDSPDGLLKRFQNTGVESRWRLLLPAVYELKSDTSSHARSKAWREHATRHLANLTPHLTEIEFTVTFTGRW